MAKLKQFFSVRWLIAHFFVLIGLILFINFGLWQLRRANQRAALNSLINSHLEQAPLSFDNIKETYNLGSKKEEKNSAAYRKAKVTGVYDIEQEVLIRNRSYNGQPGYHVLTPLRLSDNRALLVERGWVPLDLDWPPITDAAPPKGKVELEGVLLSSQEQPKGFIGAKDPPSLKLTKVFWVDIERLQKQISYTLEPIYLRLTKQAPSQSTVNTLPLEILPPSTTNGPHLGYAIQWFSFAIILFVVYILLLRNAVKEQRQIR